MNNIDYALELFARMPLDYRYEKEDHLSQTLSLMAYEQAQLGNLDAFNTIITHSRFSDYCAKKLLTRFFANYSYDSKPHPDLNEEEQTVETSLNKAFDVFLALNKLNFGILYKEHRSRYYYLIDPESENIRSVSRIEALLDYVSGNKIFIHALSLDIAQLLQFEDVQISAKMKDKINMYVKICENDLETHDLVTYFNGPYIDLNDELETRVPFNENPKRKIFKMMLAIGLYFDKYKVIGEKNTSYTEGNIQYSQSEPYFKQGIPDIFNNPYTNFSECFTLLSSVMEVEFSEEEKALALITYQDIHKNHYKYD